MSEANLLLIRVSIGATQKNPSRQNQKRPPTLKASCLRKQASRVKAEIQIV
jgi:hypothetical protein